MNILYTCDNNYIWLMGISMISLFENNKEVKEITVFLLGDGITNENKELLYDIGERYNRRINVIDVCDLNIPPILYNARWPKSAYTRLFSGILLPEEIEKVLYIDCDTIIVRNIESIYETDLKDKSIFAVKDCVGKLYKKNIGMNESSAYFNAGVLLFNVKKLREQKIASKIQDFLVKYNGLMNYADQDILNGIFCHDIGVLPAEANSMAILYYFNFKEIIKMRRPNNYYSLEEIEIAIKDPIIVHFTTCMNFLRPWYQGSKHPYVKEFIKYKNMSAWANKPLDTKVIYNLKEKFLARILLLPRVLSIFIIGILHSIIVPFVRRMRSR